MTRMMPSNRPVTGDAELRYRTLVDQVPAIVYTEVEDPSSEDGTRVTYMSSQAEALLGYPAEEFIRDQALWDRLLHPDDAERVAVENLNADLTGAPFDLEYRMIARDGTVRWFRDVARLVDEHGERFWHGVLFDVTAHTKALEDARSAERRYKSLVETLPAVVFIDAMDDAATNIYTSPQTSELLGYTAEDWMADPDLWWTLVHPDDVETITAAQQRHARLTDHVFDEEYRMIRKDGRVIWVRDIASTVFDDDGTALFAQGFLMDVTARKEAENVIAASMEREREATEQLRALDRSRSALLRTLSHDLREPVTAFIGGTTMLEHHAEELSPRERSDVLTGMRERAQRMNEVITHLLDLDRLGEAGAQAAQQRVDLCAIATEAAGERGLDPTRLTLHCDEVCVWADPDAVRAILGHLFDNAARHAPNAEVTVSVTPVDGGAELIVEDNGPGIPQGMHNAIFEAFRQGDTDVATLGMGIGLAYAQRHAELQKGHIRAEDRPGGGARFVVFLPS